MPWQPVCQEPETDNLRHSSVRIDTLWCALLLASLALGGVPQTASAEASLTNLQILDAPHATAIHLYLDGSPARIEMRTLQDPDRLVVELPGVVNETGREVFQVGSARAWSLRLSQQGGALRITIDAGGAIDPFASHGIAPTDEGLLLTIGVGTVAMREGYTPPAVEPVPALAPRAPAAPADVVAETPTEVAPTPPLAAAQPAPEVTEAPAEVEPPPPVAAAPPTPPAPEVSEAPVVAAEVAPPAPKAPQTVGAKARLTDLQILDAPHATAIHLHLVGTPGRVEQHTLRDPDRLVFELPGVVNETGREVFQVGNARAWSLRLSQQGSALRITIEAGGAINPFASHGITPTDEGLLLTVGVGTVAMREGYTPPAVESVPALAPRAPAATAEVVAEAPPVAAAPPVPTASEFSEGPLPDAEGLPPVGAAPPADPGDGPRFRITGFTAEYAKDHPEHPPLAEIMQVPIELGQAADGYVAPRAGVPATVVSLSETFPAPNDQFYASALQTINSALVREFNRRGLVAVLVAPSEEQIARRTGEDLRPPSATGLTLVVYTGRVLEVRTIASGGLVPEQETIDNPRHRRILEGSPIQADGKNDLIREDKLQEYAARLNRHPARRVDVQISPARTPGGAYVDYLVTELKPWAAYSQVSNTGTDTTTKWRQRFGFVHYQLTGHDDILALDYVTGDFDSVHAVSGFYEIPIYSGERFSVWGRPFGAWNQFDSDVVGFGSDVFHGESWTTGGSLRVNVFQYNEFFVDAIGGLRFMHAEITSDIFGTKGEDDFFIPRWGLRASRQSDRSSAFGTVTFEANVPGIAGTSLSELQDFGRGLDVDEDWVLMRFNTETSFYLEPILFREGFKDPSTPRTSTLAHEVYAKFRGQYAFDNRLIPNEMQPLGGLYTVRGYEEGEAAGDSVGVASVEYRIHIPRLFTPNREPIRVPVIGDFKAVPQHVYGRTDWDLIVKAFFDAGRSWRTRKAAFEENQTMLGAGVGVELLLRQNLSTRFDYGWALKDTTRTDRGNGEARFVVRVQY